MEGKTTKLAITLIPVEDGSNGDTKCEATIIGDVNSLLNAYEQLSVHFLRSVIESLGKDATMALYSIVQLRALSEIGVDVDAENKKYERRREVAEAFKDIVGKTFTADDIGREEG